MMLQDKRFSQCLFSSLFSSVHWSLVPPRADGLCCPCLSRFSKTCAAARKPFRRSLSNIVKACLPPVANTDVHLSLFQFEKILVCQKPAPVLKSIMASHLWQTSYRQKNGNSCCVQTVDLAVALSTTGVYLECDLSVALLSFFSSCKNCTTSSFSSQGRNELNRGVAHSCVPGPSSASHNHN